MSLSLPVVGSVAVDFSNVVVRVKCSPSGPSKVIAYVPVGMVRWCAMTIGDAMLNASAPTAMPAAHASLRFFTMSTSKSSPKTTLETLTYCRNSRACAPSPPSGS